jgi:hypothetical protein
MSSETPSPVTGAPVEPPKPAPAPAPAPSAPAVPQISQGERRERIRGQRSLFIHVLLMFLVSIVVFVIGTYFFVVPYIISQDLSLRQTQQVVADQQDQITDLQGGDEEEGVLEGEEEGVEGGENLAPAPEPAPGVEGVAPAPAPEPAPAPAPVPAPAKVP